MKKNETVPWNERREVNWLTYTIQPPKGLIKGNYYHAERWFGGNEWSNGHLGELAVVTDDHQQIVFAEFNETTMDGYYNRYFEQVSKRRSDYGIWQASVPRQAEAGVVLTDGMIHVERQILERQSLAGGFDLLTGASNSMRGLLPLAQDLALKVTSPSPKRYYGVSEDFGYGITGWLQVVTEHGRIISCFYDELFADSQDAIHYPALKRYYRQSKYHSPCFEEPEIPGWKSRGFFIGFRKLMDILNETVVRQQDLMAIQGLKHVAGADVGPIWDRCSEDERPFELPQKEIRYPVWNNYMKLAKIINKEIAAQRRDEH